MRIDTHLGKSAALFAWRLAKAVGCALERPTLCINLDLGLCPGVASLVGQAHLLSLLSEFHPRTSAAPFAEQCAQALVFPVA